MDNKTAFEEAQQKLKASDLKPSNDQKLKLYGLYKQATKGDVDPAAKPGMFDMVAVAKFNAWEAVKGLSREESMNKYIELSEQLLQS